MQELLRNLPKIDALLNSPMLRDINPTIALGIARKELEILRSSILDGSLHSLPSYEDIINKILISCQNEQELSLRNVINATGIIVHTNLGRSCLSKEAGEAVSRVARSYSNLEYDIENKCRGSRLSHIEKQLLEVTGADDVAVVNNNAAAVYLMLSALVKGTDVIVSRGELVEIGGSFRIPDIMKESGANLVEVGTTNKTHIYDIENAINDNTSAVLCVHTSNYRIIGFSETVNRKDVVEIAHKHGLLALEDLGSGTLFSIEDYGIKGEPSVLHSLKNGMDVISISGDKLLGGPQAGILLGKKEFISKIKKHPMMRALRCDKMTLAALEATLLHYRKNEQLEKIPTLRMLSEDASDVLARAKKLDTMLDIDHDIMQTEAMIGGGAAPDSPIKSYAVTIKSKNIEQLENKLRHWKTPIIVRVADDKIIIDLKTVFDDEIETVAEALNTLEGTYA